MLMSPYGRNRFFSVHDKNKPKSKGGESMKETYIENTKIVLADERSTSNPAKFAEDFFESVRDRFMDSEIFRVDADNYDYLITGFLTQPCIWTGKDNDSVTVPLEGSGRNVVAYAIVTGWRGV